MPTNLLHVVQINKQKTKAYKNKTKGFSLIELMLVLSIIALLVTLGSQGYVRHIEKSKLIQVQSDLLVFASRLEQYKLFNSNYFGAAGSQMSPENIGKPWVFEAYSPANKPEAKRAFDLSIYYVSDSGLEYQIIAAPTGKKADVTGANYDSGIFIYYSDGRRGYDKNKDGYVTDDEMCWDCL